MTVSGDPGLGDGRKSAEWGGGVVPSGPHWASALRGPPQGELNLTAQKDKLPLQAGLRGPVSPSRALASLSRYMRGRLP